MVKSLIAAAALVMLALPVTAASDEAASSDAPDTGVLFGQLDVNKDGQLMADEIPDDRKSLFDRLLRIGDKNSDGKLSNEEFAVGLGASDKGDKTDAPQQPDRPNREGRDAPGALFERLDANGDGKVELDEVPEPGRERFQKLLERVDKDGDGAVTREEFAVVAQRRAAPDGDSKPGDAKGKRPAGDRGAGQFFKRLDRNADGKLTADEIPEQRREMLERMIERGDKDSDQALSLEEFAAVFVQRRPGQPPSGDSPKPDRMPPGLFAAIDADHDGQLSSAEIADAAEAIRKLDADGDGSVTPREVLTGSVQNQPPKKKNRKKNQNP